MRRIIVGVVMALIVIPYSPVFAVNRVSGFSPIDFFSSIFGDKDGEDGRFVIGEYRSGNSGGNGGGSLYRRSGNGSGGGSQSDNKGSGRNFFSIILKFLFGVTGSNNDGNGGDSLYRSSDGGGGGNDRSGNGRTGGGSVKDYRYKRSGGKKDHEAKGGGGESPISFECQRAQTKAFRDCLRVGNVNIEYGSDEFKTCREKITEKTEKECGSRSAVIDKPSSVDGGVIGESDSNGEDGADGDGDDGGENDGDSVNGGDSADGNDESNENPIEPAPPKLTPKQCQRQCFSDRGLGLQDCQSFRRASERIYYNCMEKYNKNFLACWRECNELMVGDKKSAPAAPQPVQQPKKPSPPTKKEEFARLQELQRKKQEAYIQETQDGLDAVETENKNRDSGLSRLIYACRQTLGNYIQCLAQKNDCVSEKKAVDQCLQGIQDYISNQSSR